MLKIPEYQPPLFEELLIMSGIAAIEVRRQRGHMVVRSIGRTPRGTKFIRQEVTLTAPRTTDKDFLAEQAAAVGKLLGSEA